jgi:hypothetical protein
MGTAKNKPHQCPCCGITVNEQINAKFDCWDTVSVILEDGSLGMTGDITSVDKDGAYVLFPHENKPIYFENDVLKKENSK